MFFQYGYAEENYAEGEYFTSFNAFELQGGQFTVAIDSQQSNGFQYLSNIDDEQALVAQLKAIIETSAPVATEFLATIMKNSSLANQFLAELTKTPALATEFLALLTQALEYGFQFDSPTIAFKAMQFLTNINKNKPIGEQANFARMFHFIENPGYANDFYANYNYFDSSAYIPRAHMGMSLEVQLMKFNMFQFISQITRNKSQAMQFKAQLSHNKPMASQFLLSINVGYCMQFDVVFYNTYNLRVLRDFPSRGDGSNWVASDTMTGSFNANNLNTDIVEQCWRSPVGVTTNVSLTCDTQVPQGVFLDTFAMLNHNLSKSASILLVGATDPLFANIGFSEIIKPTAMDAFYIAPDLPALPFRYWKIYLTDTANEHGFLQIGTVVFGSSVIFNKENFTNPLKYQKMHYSDGVQTEGFTYVTNDRGIKKTLGIDFKNLEINSDNYENLTSIFDEQRTSLKCLWVPTPRYPERYAVFGKLTELPSEEHNDLGEENAHVTLSLTIDESK